MTQVWKKLGNLYTPKEIGRHPKLLSHAANPLAVHMDGDIYRIFYSGRDVQNRSSVGAVDIDIIKRCIINEHYSPFFEHGPENSFFADGVSIGNCYEVDGVQYMLFMGWQAPLSGHWRGDIGRLVVTPSLSLELDCSEAFMGNSHGDPISLSYPWVQARPSDGFDMWYGSTRSWDAGNGEMLHVIQHASSDNGHAWHRTGLAVPFQLGFAQAFSRPTVARSKDGGLDMWFSYRSGSGEKYRIGFASSRDGATWSLDLESSGIDVSDGDWDSEMIEYPFVFDHDGARYMLYNGNGYGRSGFGLAVLE
jgi:hypothetical protein